MIRKEQIIPKEVSAIMGAYCDVLKILDETVNNKQDRIKLTESIKESIKINIHKYSGHNN